MFAKLRVLLLLGLLASTPAFSQVKLGLKFTPVVSVARINDLDTATTWSTNATAVRFIFGPVIDVAFSDNYYFSTGLWYTPKRYTARPTGQTSLDARHAQFLQLPLTLKLYTDEVGLDTRIYFQIGGLGEVKISDNDQALDLNYVPPINRVNASALLSAGVEYRWGFNTTVFGGISYQRGLVNVVSGGIGGDPSYDLKSDLIGIDLGLKF